MNQKIKTDPFTLINVCTRQSFRALLLKPIC